MDSTSSLGHSTSIPYRIHPHRLAANRPAAHGEILIDGGTGGARYGERVLRAARRLHRIPAAVTDRRQAVDMSALGEKALASICSQTVVDLLAKLVCSGTPFA